MIDILKDVLSNAMSVFNTSDAMFKRLNKKYQNRYIRVINFHHTRIKHRKNFEEQIKWFKENFRNIDYAQFDEFMKTGKYSGDKPGIMLTFDDGFADNYTVAKPILEKYGFTGYFMVSSDLIGKDKYMNVQQLKEMIASGHTVTDHTATHYRMTENDDDDMLDYQIVVSKMKIEALLETKISVFTWVGGEEESYTKKAFDKIKSSDYSYGFMTNSAPVTENTDPFMIQRTNVESDWDLKAVKMAVCGITDKKYEAKRERVESLMK